MFVASCFVRILLRCFCFCTDQLGVVSYNMSALSATLCEHLFIIHEIGTLINLYSAHFTSTRNPYV